MGGGRRKEASGKEGKREEMGGEGEKERRGVKGRWRVGMRRHKCAKDDCREEHRY